MSSANVIFKEIPSGIRMPGQYGEFSFDNASRGLPANASRSLILTQRISQWDVWAATTAYYVGQIVVPTAANGHKYRVKSTTGSSGSSAPTWPLTSGGEVTDGSVVWKEDGFDYGNGAQNVPTRVFSDADVAALHGSGSIAHRMAKAVFDVNRSLDVTVIAINDAGNAATRRKITITIANAAVGTGVLDYWIGARRFTIAIADGTSAANIAAALQAEIAKYDYDLNCFAYVNSAVVTLQFKNGGTLANQVAVTAYKLTGITGTTVTIAQATAGSSDCVVTNAMTAVYAAGFTHIYSAFNDASNLAIIKTNATNMSGPTEKRGCMVYLGGNDLTGNAAAIKLLCGDISGSPTLNHERFSFANLRYSNTYNGPMAASYEIAAQYGAANASVDHPGIHRNGVALPTIAAPGLTDRFSSTEEEDFLKNGVTPLYVAPGEIVAIRRAITTRTRNAQGIQVSYVLDITAPLSMDYYRKACLDRVGLEYPRESMRNGIEKDVRSTLIDVAQRCERINVLRNVNNYIDQFIVELDEQSDWQLNAHIPTPIVPGFHVFAAVFDLVY
jgi:phage tail sheath gpL-like